MYPPKYQNEVLVVPATIYGGLAAKAAFIFKCNILKGTTSVL